MLFLRTTVTHMYKQGNMEHSKVEIYIIVNNEQNESYAGLQIISWSDKTKLWSDGFLCIVAEKWFMIKNCPDIMSDHNWDFVGHEQILVGQCPMTDCYFQPCIWNTHSTQDPEKTFYKSSPNSDMFF